MVVGSSVIGICGGLYKVVHGGNDVSELHDTV